MSNQENYVNNDDTPPRGAYSLAMLKGTGLTGAERLILEHITKSGEQHGGLYFESAKMTALRLGLAIPNVRQVRARFIKRGFIEKVGYFDGKTIYRVDYDAIEEVLHVSKW